MILYMENENPLDSVNEYFKHLGKITQHTDREETARLWKLAKKGDEAAKNKIIEMNLRLVIPTAKRFLRPGMELMDLIEEGNLGLLQAIEKFEPKKGFRFSTYAIYWIEQYIRKFIEEQSGSIKIPSHAWGNLKRWFRTWNELKEANGREPSLDEMAAALDLTARQVKSIVETLNAAKGVDSLAAIVHEEEEMTLEDTLSDDGKGNPHDVFLQQENSQAIQKSLEDLNDRDRQIIIMRYGLDDNEPKTLGEVAEQLCLSRERVRQIEERAVALLRREAVKSGILEILPQNTSSRKQDLTAPVKRTRRAECDEVEDALAKLLKLAQQQAPAHPKAKATKQNAAPKPRAQKAAPAKKVTTKKAVSKKTVSKRPAPKKRKK